MKRRDFFPVCGDDILGNPGAEPGDRDDFITGHARYRTDLALLYMVTLNQITGELQRLEMIPMRRQRFRLNAATREDVSWLCATLKRECRPLGSDVSCLHEGGLILDWT